MWVLRTVRQPLVCLTRHTWKWNELHLNRMRWIYRGFITDANLLLDWGIVDWLIVWRPGFLFYFELSKIGWIIVILFLLSFFHFLKMFMLVMWILCMVMIQVLELWGHWWINIYSGLSIIMETGIDFVQSLQSDVSVNILACLNDPADVVHAGSVSRLWHHFGELSKHISVTAVQW